MEPIFTSEDLTATDWSELFGLLSKVLGKESVTTLFDFMGSQEGIAALANPATFMHETGERVGRSLEGRAEPTQAEMEPIVRQAIPAIHSRLAKELTDPASLGSADGIEFVTYLNACGSRLGAPTIVGDQEPNRIDALEHRHPTRHVHARTRRCQHNRRPIRGARSGNGAWDPRKRRALVQAAFAGDVTNRAICTRYTDDADTEDARHRHEPVPRSLETRRPSVDALGRHSTHSKR